MTPTGGGVKPPLSCVAGISSIRIRMRALQGHGPAVRWPQQSKGERHMRLRTFALLVGVLGARASSRCPASGRAQRRLERRHTSSRCSPNPVVAYAGGIAGLQATKPAKGKKIDPFRERRHEVRRLPQGQARQGPRARSVAARSSTTTSTAYNGFAAKLTEAQATRPSAQKERRRPSRRTRSQTVDTSSTPHFLGPRRQRAGSGTSSAASPRAARQGRRRGRHHRRRRLRHLAREPELLRPHGRRRRRREAQPTSRSRAARQVHARRGVQRLELQQEADRRPVLQRRHGAATRASTPMLPWEFMSPRDYNGHGTHTSSTAGGNNGVADDRRCGRRSAAISGMAPRARIAAYKALLVDAGRRRRRAASRADLVAAIDQAVADGVDVINYSISGTTTNFLDPVEVVVPVRRRRGRLRRRVGRQQRPDDRHRRASRARGSRRSRPARTTATASARSRSATASTYNGASVGTAVGPAPFIDSTAAGVAGANADRGRALLLGAANGGTPCSIPAKVAGKIVALRPRRQRPHRQEPRGAGGRRHRDDPRQHDARTRSTPTSTSSRRSTCRTPTARRVKAYAATAGATATINAVRRSSTTRRRRSRRAFSSRGPLLAGGGDLLKPDVIAPGAGHPRGGRASGQPRPRLRPLSGTSMSSPHVAGLGGAAEAAASRLVADGDQVGADDDAPTTSSTGRTRTRS